MVRKFTKDDYLAMLKRASEKSKAKKNASMTPYYLVIAGFVITMIACILYVIFDPKKSIA